MRVLIVGCGYVGLPLGSQLAAAGHQVLGLRRSNADAAQLSAAGIMPVSADITSPSTLSKIPGPFDWVVSTVSSNKGGLDEYREVYLNGTRNLIDWLAPMGLKKFVYTSSTSVYGQTDGGIVDENSPAQPASPTSQVLVDTEQLLLQAARRQDFPTVILRVAGIYGPGRGHLFHQYLRDEARIHGSGERILNMIHREDLVEAISAALQRGKPGEIYNVADDEPVREIDFFRWLSETLRKPMPPTATDETQRKRGRTSKRVSNQKLRSALGVSLRFSNFRIGYSAEIERTRSVP